MKPIETADLLIRDSIWDDLKYFETWERRPEVHRFFSIKDGQSFEELVRAYVGFDQDPKTRQLTICLRESGEPAGRIILGDLEEGWKVEIWRIYIADTALRGRGYGRQAMEAILKLCFEELNLERVYLDHYTGNPAAYLYQKLGFQYEGVLRKNCRKNGRLHDVHLMSMLKEEYFAKYGA